MISQYVGTLSLLNERESRLLSAVMLLVVAPGTAVVEIADGRGGKPRRVTFQNPQVVDAFQRVAELIEEGAFVLSPRQEMP